jgi:predicted PurR-regulated permease PerM
MSWEGRHIGFWLGALLALLLGLAVFKDILLPFVVGMILAYFLNPLADRLEQHGLSRRLAASLIMGVVGTVVIVGLVLLVPLLTAQVQQLATSLPSDIVRVRAAIEEFARERLGSHAGIVQSGIEKAVKEMEASTGSILRSLAEMMWSRGASLINLVSVLLITPLVVFYLLVDWHPMVTRVRLWLPRDHAATIDGLAGDINDAVAAFIRGQGAVCLCLGLFYAIALTLAGLNYGALVGLATGIAAFVPMVGWAIGTAVAVLIAALQFLPKWTPVLAVAGIMVGGMALDTALLSPRMVGQKVGLHPVWLIFALFAFSLLFGVVGTLVAVPVSAAIGVLARFGIARYLNSDVYRGRTAALPIAANDGGTP